MTLFGLSLMIALMRHPDEILLVGLSKQNIFNGPIILTQAAGKMLYSPYSESSYAYRSSAVGCIHHVWDSKGLYHTSIHRFHWSQIHHCIFRTLWEYVTFGGNRKKQVATTVIIPVMFRLKVLLIVLLPNCLASLLFQSLFFFHFYPRKMCPLLAAALIPWAIVIC